MLSSIQTFPVEVKKHLGKALLDLQKGNSLTMPLSKSMSSVALGVEELRIRDDSGAFRIFYFKKSSKGILIFHAFVKKTQQTPQKEIETGRKRFKE
jgi:phage-related protein